MIDVDRLANSVARKYRCGRADHVKFSPVHTDFFVSDHVRYGYRKNTTGEYVPNKYLSNFGWKNTYYQEAITTVTMPLWVGWLAGDDL